MESVEDPVRQNSRDDAALTRQLFDRMIFFHSVPRLRQQLAKVTFADFESQVSSVFEKDLTYLISALGVLVGKTLDPVEYPNLAKESGEFLRRCDSCGLTIYQFLSGSAKRWDDIRPKYQELVRQQFEDMLPEQFPGLPRKSADRLAGYLLTHSLVRWIPAFPFHEKSPKSGIIVVRAQPDLPWNLVTGPKDYVSTFETHFPEVDWSDPNHERKLWFSAIRLVSKFSPKTASVLKEALKGTACLSTSLVRDRRKLLHVVFFSEADANLFKFNLHHHAKLAGTFYEIFDSSLAEFRKGYPGLSGFTGEEMRYEMTAGDPP
jgi:hypothetical protein